MVVLSNSQLELSFDANTARWNLRLAEAETPALIGVRCGLTVRDAHARRLKWNGMPKDVSLSEARQAPSPHGPLRAITAIITPAPDPVISNLRQRRGTAPLTELIASNARFQLRLELAVPEARPFVLWRFTVENVGPEPLYLQEIDLAVIGSRFHLGLEPPASHLQLHPTPGRLAFFSNGYQSWSYTGALQAGMRLPFSRLNRLDGPKMLNLLNPAVDGIGHFTSDMFAALGDRAHNVGLVVGFTAQREQFGHIETLLIDARSPYLRLAAHGDDVPVLPGAARVTDWAYAQFIALEEADPLAEYALAVARENQARVPDHTPVGWCSWYHYYDRVTEQAIVNNVAAIARQRDRIPLEFVQIDDGYQAQVGDWFKTKPTFPHGLKWLAEQIRAQGSTPGLWLAPYIVRSDAEINRQHPDWFLRDARGVRVSAGLNWFRWCFALDPTHPGVREHTRRLIETAVNEWGFPYLKLDFLYAAALPAKRYDPMLTRAQAMRLALTDIREAAGPDTFLLGCGCPLGPAVGIVDGMRISTDVAPNWHPELLSPMFSRWLESELGFVSARNAVKNIISRAPLHRRWWLNDPDCLLVRDVATRLTEAEVRCLATVIGLSGGIFLVSDDLTRVNPERFRYIQALMPVLKTGAYAPDWLNERAPEEMMLKMNCATGRWWVVGVFNWDNGPRPKTFLLDRLGLEPGAYWVSDFWEATVTRLDSGCPLEFASIPAHGAHLVALRPVTSSPTLISSSFHFSQGGEVTEWELDRHTLRFKVTLGRVASGMMRLALPATPHTALVDGKSIHVEEAGQGLYALRFTVTGEAWVQVVW